MALRCAVFAAFATAFLPAPARAQGGPPLITDDPDTPGPAYWEVNIATLMEKTHQRRLELPRVDLNYGVGRRIQLKFEMPLVVLQNEDHSIETGPGAATVGVKWRFIGQEGQRIAWSVYPQLDFNTAHSSVTKGIEPEGLQFLMPTEMTIEIFHLEVNGEMGRNFVENGPGRWVFGVSTEGHVLPRLELLADLHGERATGESTDVIAVGGGRFKLTSKMIVLLAIGHTVRSLPDEGPRSYAYTGLQLTLPGQFKFEPEIGRRPRRP
jgi:hypothetical protein